MAELAGDWISTLYTLPLCTAHRRSAVDEAMKVGMSVLKVEKIRLKTVSSALKRARVFEKEFFTLPQLSSLYHKETMKQVEVVEAMLRYLAQESNFCGKDDQKPVCEGVCAVTVLELLLLQLKDEVGLLVEICQLLVSCKGIEY